MKTYKQDCKKRNLFFCFFLSVFRADFSFFCTMFKKKCYKSALSDNADFCIFENEYLFSMIIKAYPRLQVSYRA